MQIKLKSGVTIEFREKISDFNFEMVILTVDKKELIVPMDPDEFKWVALHIHRVANQAI